MNRIHAAQRILFEGKQGEAENLRGKIADRGSADIRHACMIFLAAGEIVLTTIGEKIIIATH